MPPARARDGLAVLISSEIIGPEAGQAPLRLARFGADDLGLDLGAQGSGRNGRRQINRNRLRAK